MKANEIKFNDIFAINSIQQGVGLKFIYIGPYKIIKVR